MQFQMVQQLHPNNLVDGEVQVLVQKLNLIQDQGLEVISECWDTLKIMASEMNEELDRQIPLMDETECKIDKAISDLKNTRMLGLRTRLIRVLKK